MTEETSTLQDFPLRASIEAVKASADFASYADFRQYLLDHLPQNSPETRARYVRLLEMRYFPARSLDNLLTRVWKTYRDERLLVDLMRVYALEAERVIARFVLDRVLPLPVGQVFDQEIARGFVRETYGTIKKKSYSRLLLTVRLLGFLGRYGGQLVVEEIPTPRDALLILLHDRLAPTPRIVRVGEILDARWPWFLGFKSHEAVRQVLRQAEDARLLARYAVVDELEQVTTRFSRDEYIGGARRL